MLGSPDKDVQKIKELRTKTKPALYCYSGFEKHTSEQFEKIVLFLLADMDLMMRGEQ